MDGGLSAGPGEKHAGGYKILSVVSFRAKAENPAGAWISNRPGITWCIRMHLEMKFINRFLFYGAVFQDD
jgi:hypothetical protein